MKRLSAIILFLGILSCLAGVQAESRADERLFLTDHPVFNTGSSLAEQSTHDVEFTPLHKFHHLVVAKTRCSTGPDLGRQQPPFSLGASKGDRLTYAVPTAYPVRIGMKLLFPKHYFW